MIKSERLVMIPGPTPVVRSIQNEMGRPTVAFGDPDFIKDYKQLILDLQELWNCGPGGQAFVISGSGTLGMEMALANGTKRGDAILVCTNGAFGDRFIKMCQRKGLEVDVLRAERWGMSVTADMVSAKLKEKKYAAVTVTHIETSTGVAAPIKEIGDVLASYPETIYIVDAVAAAGGAEENLKEMYIDILISCSQKAFGVCPGLTLLWASEKALQKRESLGELIPESYCDFNEWIPVMRDPAKYWGTPPINLIWALKESVRLMKEEGLVERYARHIRQGRMIDEAMGALGLTVAAQEPWRAPTLSVYLYPQSETVDDVAFRNLIAAEGAQVAGCLGDFAGKGFRMGHMGNIDKHLIVSAVAAVERACLKAGMNVQPGAAMSVLQKGLVEE